MITIMKSWHLRFAAVAVSIFCLTIGLFGTACTNDQNAQPPDLVEGVVVFSGIATEIVSPNISIKTATSTVVLKFNNSTSIIRADGTAGTINDLRPGINIKVTYDLSTALATRMEIQPIHGTILATGTVTGTVGPTISLRTQTGQPLVLRADNATAIVKADGTNGVVSDLSAGSNVIVYYYPSKFIARIEIQ